MFLTASGFDACSDNGSESDAAAGASAISVADELLVISLGVSNECPGMLPEHKVMRLAGERVANELYFLSRIYFYED
jgi:hypothetical protein